MTSLSLERDTESATDQCGTYSGYQRHGREGTERCDACKQANREYMRDYRQGSPRRHEEAARNNARSRALWQLANEYPERFRELCSAELAKVAPGDAS